ncbi:MAG TPA: hypothetical protein VF691_13195, partial [Cytophagaceae bacterium]
MHNLLKKALIVLLIIWVQYPFIGFSQELKVDISRTAFSTYGSYMAISRTAGEDNIENLYLRDVSGNRLWNWNGIFKIEVIKNGSAVSYKTVVTPERLTLKVNDNETIEFAFQDIDAIRIRGNNLSLRLTQTIKDVNSYYIPLKDNAIRAQMGGYAHYYIKAMSGKMDVDGIQTLERGERDKLHLILDFKPAENGIFNVAVQQYTTGIKKVD